MIDIHSHIIPFVDDGSSSMEESIKMIEESINQGVKTIIATPHHIYHKYEKSVEEIIDNFNLLKEEVNKRNLDVNLLLGQEIFYSGKEDIISMLKNKELLTLNNTNYVLLEFQFFKEVEDLPELIYNFYVNDYKVIIAHVERYEWITLELIENVKKEGALIQINSGSILGKNGPSVKRFVKKLLKRNLVDFIASDMHSFRTSTMLEAQKKCKKEELFSKDLF